MTTASPSIAIAFGAGGARGLAHIHAIAAFDELGLKPIAISGTSIGSIMGAGMAAGMTGAEIDTFAREKFRLRRELLADLWRARPSNFAAFLREGAARLGELHIEKILDVFLPDAIPETFEALAIPFEAVATDYFGHKPCAFSAGPLYPALAASACIPAAFRPVDVEGTIYVDGGITNPVPFDQLQGKADIIIGIDVAGGPMPPKGKRRMPGKIDALYASSQLMQRSIAEAMARSCQVDIYLRPDVGGFRVLDFAKTISILDQTVPFRDEVKRAIDKVMAAHAAA